MKKFDEFRFNRLEERARQSTLKLAERSRDDKSQRGRIILNEDKQTERPKLLDAYGVEIEPEEEPYIPCLDGTDQCPPRNRIVRNGE